MIRRSDDNAEALKKRLVTYHAQTKPLINYYSLQGLHYKIDASRAASEVFDRIDSIFTKKQERKATSLQI